MYFERKSILVLQNRYMNIQRFTLKALLTGLVFASVSYSYGQEREYGYEGFLNTGLSSDVTLPFWLESNRYGTIPDSNHLLLNTAIFSDYTDPDKFFDFSFKASATGYIATESKLLLNELYVGIRLQDFLIDIGSKNDEVLWNNLSSSNGNILKSINARAMPGISLKTDGFCLLYTSPSPRD